MWPPGRAVDCMRRPNGDGMLDNVVATHHPIAKDISRLPRRPNLVDYDAVRANFDWVKARELLDGLPAGRGLNIAHEAVDRHAQGPRADRVALRWIGKTGARHDFTYRALAAETNR